mmetsp:Transcript_1666/g.4082  ORF Transcript_1666/g.4082 Transcript_1666/m.4082 type:complete len:529 (+) Transcript_1666:325-1911(+)
MPGLRIAIPQASPNLKQSMLSRLSSHSSSSSGSSHGHKKSTAGGKLGAWLKKNKGGGRSDDSMSKSSAGTKQRHKEKRKHKQPRQSDNDNDKKSGGDGSCNKSVSSQRTAKTAKSASEDSASIMSSASFLSSSLAASTPQQHPPQRQQRKTVQFQRPSKIAAVRYIEHIDAYSDAEWEACFYTKTEFDAITRKANKVVAKYIKHFHKAKRGSDSNGHEAKGGAASATSGDGIPTTDPSSLFDYRSSSNKKLCIRGLEKFFTLRQNQVDRVRIKAIDIVMDTQEEQWQWGHSDEEQIATQYHECTKHCLKEAQDRAAQDQLAIRKFARRHRSRSKPRASGSSHKNKTPEGAEAPSTKEARPDTGSRASASDGAAGDDGNDDDNDDDTVMTADSNFTADTTTTDIDITRMKTERPFGLTRAPRRGKRSSLQMKLECLPSMNNNNKAETNVDSDKAASCAEPARNETLNGSDNRMSPRKRERRVLPRQAKLIALQRRLSEEIQQIDPKILLAPKPALRADAMRNIRECRKM